MPRTKTANAATLGVDLDGVEMLDLSPDASRFTEGERYSVFAPDEVENESVTDRVVAAVERVDPDRVFVDPITRLQYLSADEFQFRQEVAGLMSYLEERGATTLFTTQPDDDLQYICDGSIILDRGPTGRSLSVEKFRGSGFRSGHHALAVDEAGITVFPKLVPGEHDREFDAERIGSGVAELDDLLGGGIERGSVTVVSGPSGVGKSTTGTHFLADAAARDERAAAYLFEESEASLRHRSRSIGLPVDDLIADGSLSLECIEPLALSSDEFAYRVREEVEERGARVVMIDGTAGYKLSLRGEESTLVSELHALVRYLRNVGVTVILIEGTGSVTGEFQPTREGISYLADNILFLRYLELDGEIRKAVGVLKKRLGGVEPTLRELRITEDGLWIGDPLDGLRGVLTGTPEWADDGGGADTESVSEYDASPVDGATGDADRVLLLVDGDKDRELLAERLGDRYDVVVGDPDGEWGPVDLCVVDARSYRTAEPALRARRRDAAGYLPVLLLVPERDDRERRREPEWVAEALDGPVDDVLVVPAPRHELDARTAALLRMRRQSHELALYRRAMDETVVGITISDPSEPDNPLVYANDAFVATTGYDRGAALGRNCRFLQGPDTDEETVAEVRAAIDDERPVSVELLNYRADGEPFWNRLTIAPVRDRAGEATHFVGFQQDVTDHVDRGRALEQYETIVETTTEPICVLDAEGRFAQVNDAMVVATGYSRDELLGSHASTVATDDAVDRAERQIREVLRGERDRASFEASLVGADGRSREYAMSMSVLRGPDGFEGTVLVAHDVTDLHEHQRRLSVLDRVLRHNLRNKLNVVLARAAEIRHESDDESVREAAAAVERAGSDLMAHGEAVRRFDGVLDPRRAERERLDIAAVVNRALEGLRATYPGTVVESDVPASAPVDGDETLTLAVEELLQNAAQHGSSASPDATVVGDVSELGSRRNGDGEDEVSVVRVTVTDDPDAGVVEVVVDDDGPGISEAGRRALERGAETQLEHTTGLGLWLVRWAVENVGGDIDIAENDPQGTVITLRLPRAE